MSASTYLGSKDLHGAWHVDSRNCTHKCQNGKIVHTHLGIAPCQLVLRFANVVCESWGPICISYIPYVVHWSICPACTGELNLMRVGHKTKYRKWQKMAKNAHTHGGGKWSTCPTRTRVCSRIGSKCYVSNMPFGRRPNPPGFGNGRFAK